MAGSPGLESPDQGISKTLLLASDDMRQAAAAARFLQGLRVETGELAEGHYSLIGVFETGLVVAYMRPFSYSRSKSFRPLDPNKFVPSKWRPLHDRLKALRDQVYAHTDDHPNRDASVAHGERSAGMSGFSLNVHTVGLSLDDLEAVIVLCDSQAARFQATVAMRQILGRDLPRSRA